MSADLNPPVQRQMREVRVMREPAVRYTVCANPKCRAPGIPLTETLLDCVASINRIRARMGERLFTDEDIALCDPCHIKRREVMEWKGRARHEREQELWRGFRNGEVSEQKLIEGCADKIGIRDLVRRYNEAVTQREAKSGKRRNRASGAFE